MRAVELAERIPDAVQFGEKWKACCPAHDDRCPSLTFKDGDKCVLLRCFAGCPLEEVCKSLGLRPSDLFFDALDRDPQQRRAAAQKREQKRHDLDVEMQKRGRRIDALREADYFVRSREGLDISGWSHSKLDDELNVLASAYALLSAEAYAA